MQETGALGWAQLGAGHVTVGLGFPIRNMEGVRCILSLFSLGPVISDCAEVPEAALPQAACRLSLLGSQFGLQCGGL